MVRVNDNFDPRSVNENKPSLVERTRTTNKAGGEAFEAFTPEFGLFKQTINNLLEDTYYQTAEELLEDLVVAFDSAADEDPEFVLQLATYARHEEGLRDVAQVLLALSAYDDRTKPYVRDYTPSIIDRMDEFNSVTSLALDLIGKNPNKPLSKGIEDALHKRYAIVEYPDGSTERVTFVEDVDDGAYADAIVHLEGEVLDSGYVFDEYTASKYMERDKEVSLYDVINLVRPKPRSEERDNYFGRIVRGELDAYDDEPLRQDRTWEAERSSETTRATVEFTASDFAEAGQALSESVVKHGGIVPFELERTRDAWIVSANTLMDEIEDVVDIFAEAEGAISRQTNASIELTDVPESIVIGADVRLTEAGEWRHRLDDMGLMARVRNLRNMLEAGLSGDEIFDYDDYDPDGYDEYGRSTIFGPESARRVREHQMFPFRFYQAYRAVDRPDHIEGLRLSDDISSTASLDVCSEGWLNAAIDVSAENLPETLDNTFTAVDLSGSMDQEISGNSNLARQEIATLFGSTLMKRGSHVGAFGSKFAVVTAEQEYIDETPTLELAKEIYSLSSDVGNKTNGWKALKWATDEGHSFDRFVVFTDEQIWDSSSWRSNETMKKWWDEYRDRVNPDAHLYIIDLASYGDLSMPEGYHNVHQISGWSDNVLDYINSTEQADDVIAEIKQISPGDY